MCVAIFSITVLGKVVHHSMKNISVLLDLKRASLCENVLVDGANCCLGIVENWKSQLISVNNTKATSTWLSRPSTRPSTYLASQAKYFISVLKHQPRSSTSPSTNITAADGEMLELLLHLATYLSTSSLWHCTNISWATQRGCILFSTETARPARWSVVMQSCFRNFDHYMLHDPWRTLH